MTYQPPLPGFALDKATRQRLAIEKAAPLVRHADMCPGTELATILTEKAYRHLARAGLDFRPDTITAIDAHLAGRHRRAAKAATRATACRCAVCGTRTGNTYCQPCGSAVLALAA